jgi:hypothetical protein
MRKSVAFFLPILMMVLLASACLGDEASSTPLHDTISPELPQDGTIGAVCGDVLLAFERAASENPIVSLTYRDGQAYTFALEDKDAVEKIYQTIIHVPLGKTVNDPCILDGDIDFSFVRKNGEEFTVRFVTPNYYELCRTEDAQQQYYEVLDTSLVGYCKETAMAANEGNTIPERPIFGDMFPLETEKDVCKDIDLDGDGQNDSLYFDFIDNGDEAYGALELSIDTADATCRISFYPADKDSVFALGVPYPFGRSLLLVGTDAQGGWPSCLHFLTMENGKLLRYSLEDVSITDYDNGVFTLSDHREIRVNEMKFEAVAQ